MHISVMENDDKIQLVHDSASNIWKVVREKTESERFWTGIRISCICISLVSIFGIGNKNDNEYQIISLTPRFFVNILITIISASEYV